MVAFNQTMLQSVVRQDAEIALLRQRLLAISQTVSRMSDAMEKHWNPMCASVPASKPLPKRNSATTKR